MRQQLEHAERQQQLLEQSADYALTPYAPLRRRQLLKVSLESSLLPPPCQVLGAGGGAWRVATGRVVVVGRAWRRSVR